MYYTPTVDEKGRFTGKPESYAPPWVHLFYRNCLNIRYLDCKIYIEQLKDITYVSVRCTFVSEAFFAE